MIKPEEIHIAYVVYKYNNDIHFIGIVPAWTREEEVEWPDWTLTKDQWNKDAYDKCVSSLNNYLVKFLASKIKIQVMRIR